MKNSHLIESHTDESAKDPEVQRLVDEAKAYGEIKRKYRWFSNKPEGTQAYVMPKQWVRKWKNYTSYKQVKRNKLPLVTIGKEHPGQIGTKNLLESFQNYLRDDDEDDPANTILKTGVRDYYDFSLYSKELWDFFYSRYKGIPIRRKFEKVGMGMTRVEYRPKPINLVIVPQISQILEDSDKDLPAPQKMYISIHRNVKDLMARIHLLLTSQCGYDFNKENFRAWKLNHQVDVGEVNMSVKNGLKIFKEGKGTKANNELPNNVKNDEKDSPKTAEGGQKEEKKESAVQINANIYLRGFNLNQLTDSKVEDTDIADNDLIVVEIEDLEHEPHYIFRYKKGEKISFGKCEYCAQKKRLIVQCVCKEVDYCSEDCRRRDERFHQARCTADFQADEQTEESQMGVVGLQNLGNTCFLNSSLQCLSNTWELTNYFLKRLHESEINLDNPLGSNKAHLVKTYSQLVNALWFGRQKSLSPFQFKRALGQFQPNFKGYNQHDSHEALNFILDGIHEDLNRVKKKPLVESKASNNRPDSIVAHESWVGHLRRNQSIIVDLMHGQFKSTLDCPKCKGTSVTFDPFSSIGLPVALMKDLVWDVIFVPSGNFEKPCLKTQLSFKRKVPVERLREKFQEIFTLGKNYNFIVAIVEDDTLVKFLSNHAVTDIFDSYSKRTHKIFLYQIDDALFEMNKHQVTKDVKMEENEPQEGDQNKTNDDLTNLQLLEQNEAQERDLLSKFKALPIDNCNESVNPRFLRTLVQNSYATYSSNMAPPRVMFFDRESTVQQIHLQVFRAVSPMFHKYFKKNDMNPQEIETNYAKIFCDENKKAKKDYYSYYSSYTNRLPYKVKIVNKLADIGRRSDECFFCAKSYCNNCELPEGKSAFVYFEKKKKGSYASDLYGDPETTEGEEKIELTLNHLLALIPKRKGKELMANMHHYVYDENTAKSQSSYSYYGYNSYGSSHGSRYGKPKEFEVSDNLDFELMIEWSRSNCNSIYDVDPTNLSYFTSVDEPQKDNNPKNDNRDDENGGLENDDEDEKYDDRIKKSAKRIAAKKMSSFTLEGCLKYFEQPEQLQPQNEWYCGRCKDHVLATKRVQIYKAPPILLILFKRFKMTNQTRSGYSSSYYYFSSSGASEGEKITDLIRYPLMGLDIASFLVDPAESKCTVYDLFAVSNHYGSVGFGHYTAYAKNSHTGKWYYYDDSRVSEVKDSSEVISEAAYSLFYRRRDLKNTEINYNELKMTIDPNELAAIEKAEEEERQKEREEKERKKKAEEEAKALAQLGGDAGAVEPQEDQGNGSVSY